MKMNIISANNVSAEKETPSFKLTIKVLKAFLDHVPLAELTQGEFYPYAMLYFSRGAGP